MRRVYWLTAFWTVTLLVCCYTVSTAQSKKSIRLFDEGKTAYFEKRYDEAIDKLGEAYQESRRVLVDALLFRGYAYYEEKRYEEAIRSFDAFSSAKFQEAPASQWSDATRKNVAYASAHEGWAMLDDNRPAAEAQARFQRAVNLLPSYGFAYNGLGYAHFKQGKYSDAVTAYNAAIQQGFTSNFVFCNRADAYYRQDNFVQAANDYQQAIRIDSQYRYYYQQALKSWQYAGRAELAIDMGRRLLKRFPSDSIGHWHLTELLMNRDSYDQAITQLKLMGVQLNMSKRDRLVWLDRLAFAHFRTQQYPESETYFKSLYNEAPSAYSSLGNADLNASASIRMWRTYASPFIAECIYRKGDVGHVRQWLDVILTDSSASLWSYVNAALAYTSLGIRLQDTSSAQTQLRLLDEKVKAESRPVNISALQWDKEKRGYQSEGLAWSAYMHQLMGEWSSALALATQSNNLQPNALAQSVSAAAWYRSGNKVLAKKLLLQQSALPRRFAEADALAAGTWIQLDSAAAAIDAFRRYSTSVYSFAFASQPALTGIRTLTEYAASNRNFNSMQALLEQLMRSYPTDLTLTQSYLFLQEKIGAFEQEKNPPRIRIISPADWESRGIEIGEEEETVNLVGMVEDESGIGSVMVNGKPVYWTSQGQFSTTVALPEPINHFVIEATDTKGNKATLRLALSASKGSTAALDTANAANYYALLIGVSQQKDTRISAIVSAADDVRRLRKTLLENYQFSEDRIRTLQNPTRASLLNELEAISLNMGANDNLLVFYAGHGTYIASGVVEQGYWLPYDAERGQTSSFVSNSDVKERIGRSRARHVLLVSDACFAGSIFRSDELLVSNVNYKALYSKMSRKAITSGNLELVPAKSVFIERLLQELEKNRKPYSSARELFQALVEPVAQTTGNQPQYGLLLKAGGGDGGTETGDFIFIRKK